MTGSNRLWTLPISNGAATEIESVFGETPNINGEIDTDIDEWEEVEFNEVQKLENSSIQGAWKKPKRKGMK